MPDPKSVKCPFCAEEIKPEAVVCKHCRRDLSVVKAAYDELRDLRTALAAANAEVDALRAALAPTPAEQPVLPEVRRARGSAVVGAVAMIVPLLLLLFAHYLIIIRFDADTLILRVASIAIPLLCAVAVATLRHQSLTFSIVAASLLGIVAVSAMSAVVSRVDQVAFLPSSVREWREIVEYMASISLSFITGALLVRGIGRRHDRAAKPDALFVGMTTKLNKLIDRTVATAESVEKRAQSIQNLVTATAPALAAAGAVATGLRSWLP
ncbi:MAG: hypothetical protein HY060_06950 [Proteobacteria bacterium]|nr:hypothetical protein [Pseudomonadota bacterium]